MKKTNFVIGNFILVAIILFMGINVYSQTEWKNVEIKTTAECQQCKDRIEKAVNKLDGIKSVDLVIDTKICKVSYDEKVVTLKEIREKIASVGYDADDVKKDPRAYKRLPKCCQIDGHKDHEHEH